MFVQVLVKIITLVSKVFIKGHLMQPYYNFFIYFLVYFNNLVWMLQLELCEQYVLLLFSKSDILQKLLTLKLRKTRNMVPDGLVQVHISCFVRIFPKLGRRAIERWKYLSWDRFCGLAGGQKK